MWCKGSEPVACYFLDTELEAQIGERGFWVCNSSIQFFSAFSNNKNHNITLLELELSLP